jgi:hypothetical protein
MLQVLYLNISKVDQVLHMEYMWEGAVSGLHAQSGARGPYMGAQNACVGVGVLARARAWNVGSAGARGKHSVVRCLDVGTLALPKNNRGACGSTYSDVRAPSSGRVTTNRAVVNGLGARYTCTQAASQRRDD